MTEEKDFWVQCNVCKTQWKNWVGSTPCCGSIAFLVGDDGEVSKDFLLYGKIGGEKVKTVKITQG